LILVIAAFRFFVAVRKSGLKEIFNSFIKSENSNADIFIGIAFVLLTIMAAFSRRLIPLAFIAGAFILSGQILWLFKFKFKKLIAIFLFSAIFSYSAYNLIYIDYFQYYSNISRQWPEESLFEMMHMSSMEFPKEMVNFLNDNNIKGNMFCEWEWEGFIRWNCPEIKTFVGSRAFSIYDEDTYKQYLDIFYGDTKGDEIIRDFQNREVEIIAMFRKPANENFFSKISLKKEWLIIFSNANCIILVNSKNKKFNDLLINALNRKLIFRNSNTADNSYRIFFKKYNLSN
jgi:hypothetical protein